MVATPQRSRARQTCDGAPGRSAEEAGITEREAEDVEERSSPRAPVIYEIVRRHGEEELRRPAVSLWWSGVAAGLSISFSLLAQGLLQQALPETPWRPLVASFGYCVGFVIVVLGRQQLFTENTITIVLPVMAEPTAGNVMRLARAWAIVFAANMAGTAVAALFCSFAPVIDPALHDAMLTVSRHMMENGPAEMFSKGIASGFLIAAMVWLIPSAGSAHFHIVILMTWLIAAGGFTHIIAGSMEAFMLVVAGEISVGTLLGGFMLPVLAGNIVGGTVLFALIAYGQVMKEIEG